MACPGQLLLGLQPVTQIPHIEVLLGRRRGDAARRFIGPVIVIDNRDDLGRRPPSPQFCPEAAVLGHEVPILALAAL